jgi:iron complex transport system permease protein
MSIRRRITTVVAAFAVFAIAVMIWAPTVGSTPISLARAFDRSIPWDDNVDAQIFFVARLPRVLAGGLVGATLAAAGVVLQALLRNPLATPFTLGVSAGASLGAMLAVTMRLELSVLGITSIPLASFAGSLLATAIVYALASSQRRGLSTNVLLLAGVTLNAFFSALILFVQYLADFAEALRAIRWMMGGLDVASYVPIVAALPLVLISFGAFAMMTRTLNLLSVGAEAAASRGVNIVGAQRLAFLSASLATGAAVSLGGPIGFIGIIVPHLVRLMVGSDHRIVLPASALFGAAFLVLCDLAARTLMSPLEIPVGVVTALIGGPFFLWLLVRRS